MGDAGGGGVESVSSPVFMRCNAYFSGCAKAGLGRILSAWSANSRKSSKVRVVSSNSAKMPVWAGTPSSELSALDKRSLVSLESS